MPRSPKDPFAQREAQRYDQPIASREYITSVLENAERGLTLAQLHKQLDLKSRQAQEALRRRLKAMMRDKQLDQRKGRYRVREQMPTRQGRVSLHRDGYGFVTLEGYDEDVFLPAHQARHLMQGDLITVRVVRERTGRFSAICQDVVQRAKTHLVGRYELRDGRPWLQMLGRQDPNCIELVPGGCRAQAGDYVRAAIHRYPSKQATVQAQVVEVLGQQDSAGIAFSLASESFDWPRQWSQEALAEVSRMRAPEDETSDHADWTDVPFVTIDGVTAKDFDDAIYVEALSHDQWRLCVAIADVSHYVRPGSALDVDARERATSVYYPGHVIPMLPPQLSDQWCSLQPQQIRFALVADMRLDADGCLRDLSFVRARIRSKARLTYQQVADMMADQVDVPSWWQASFDASVALYQALKQAHDQRGALQMVFDETVIVVNEQGFVDRMQPLQRLPSHELIEMFMLKANEAVATYLTDHDVPALFRVHEAPSPRKIKSFCQLLKAQGLQKYVSRMASSSDLSDVLTRLREAGQGRDVAALKLLPQATYAATCRPHYGLALDRYTHFTSPIRRYPDLVVHRALVAGEHRAGHQRSDLKVLAQHCSDRERLADQSSRMAHEWLKADYMTRHQGETFEARVLWAERGGVWVCLDALGVEGRVPESCLLQKSLTWDERSQTLQGPSGLYRAGVNMFVMVSDIYLERCLIMFREVAGADR